MKQYNKTLQVMVSFAYFTKENIKEHNWLQISDHPYILLITEVLDLEQQIHYFI